MLPLSYEALRFRNYRAGPFSSRTPTSTLFTTALPTVPGALPLFVAAILCQWRRRRIRFLRTPLGAPHEPRLARSPLVRQVSPTGAQVLLCPTFTHACACSTRPILAQFTTAMSSLHFFWHCVSHESTCQCLSFRVLPVLPRLLCNRFSTEFYGRCTTRALLIG